MEKVLQLPTSDCLRIVLYGPESTGKTTMAKALAAHYNTQWVPEYARTYLQQKWDQEQQVCNQEDLIAIVQGQLKWENTALKAAQQFLFCDTNCLVTRAWSETHFEGYCAPELLEYVDNTHYDFYFLTHIDVPWEADDLRDRPQHRTEMLTHFEQLLQANKLPYSYLKGSHEERMKTAILQLDKLQIEQV